VTTALHTEGGQPAAYVNIVRDITEKRAAHEAVLESERRFRVLVNGVTDYAIFMLSPEGVVTNWNSGARRIKGYAAEEIIGSHFSRFYTPEDAATGLPQRGLTAAARDGRFEAEGWRVRKDGSRFWAQVVIDAIRDEDGMLAGFAKITRDITERTEANRVLEETRTALFQSQQMEAIGKLTGGVAHDLNNVLQVLRGNLRAAGKPSCRRRMDPRAARQGNRRGRARRETSVPTARVWTSAALATIGKTRAIEYVRLLFARNYPKSRPTTRNVSPSRDTQKARSFLTCSRPPVTQNLHRRKAEAGATHPGVRGVGRRDARSDAGSPCRLS